MAKNPKQQQLFTAETTWFHVFKAMIDNGDVAKMGPYAVTVYLVIKSYTNFATGLCFPSIDTIAEKSGISEKMVRNCLKVLVENKYIDKRRVGRNNVYTLREKIDLMDMSGRPAAVATWDYLPASVEAARAELRRFQLTGEKGQIIHIENMTLNVQINQGEGNNSQFNIGWEHIEDKALRETVFRAWKKSSEKNASYEEKPENTHTSRGNGQSDRVGKKKEDQ